ncbi:hypothetical protein SK128_021821, partial [Halocaridina rubra]
ISAFGAGICLFVYQSSAQTNISRSVCGCLSQQGFDEAKKRAVMNELLSRFFELSSTSKGCQARNFEGNNKAIEYSQIQPLGSNAAQLRTGPMPD